MFSVIIFREIARTDVENERLDTFYFGKYVNSVNRGKTTKAITIINIISRYKQT